MPHNPLLPGLPPQLSAARYISACDAEKVTAAKEGREPDYGAAHDVAYNRTPPIRPAVTDDRPHRLDAPANVVTLTRPTIFRERSTKRFSVDASPEITTVINDYGTQRTILESALVIAAERYEENAKGLRETSGGRVDSYDRLAEQFDRQAKDARDLLAKFTGEDEDEECTAILIIRRPTESDDPL